MYKCNNCKEIFVLPKVVSMQTGVECEGYVEAIDVEVCPECGSNDFEDAFSCEWCGEYKDNMITDIWCEDCYEKMEHALNMALSSFRQQFSEDAPTAAEIRSSIELAHDVIRNMEENL